MTPRIQWRLLANQLRGASGTSDNQRFRVAGAAMMILRVAARLRCARLVGEVRESGLPNLSTNTSPPRSGLRDEPW